MSINFKSLLEVMVPASAKVDKISNQWLEPASYDEKMVKAMKGEGELIYDQEAPENQAHNFRAQDLVKKNKKPPLMGKPLSEDNAEAISSEGFDSVNAAYEEESLELLEEIMDLIDGIDEDTAPRYGWRSVSRALKEARDSLLSSVVSESLNEEYLDEDFKEGKFKLKDGSNVKLTKEDVKVLNFALSGTDKKKEMLGELSKNKHEFNQFLTFARSLKEDYEPTLASLMEDLSIEDLNYIAENELSEAELWTHIRAGGSAGAAVGSTVGAIAGGVFGASLGAGVAASKSVNRYMKNRKLKKAGVADRRMIKSRHELDESNDQNNEKQSILGTSAPALDSDPNTAKPKKPLPKSVTEEDLQEISKETAEKYVKRASGEHTMANMARRSLEGQPSTDGGKALEYWKRQEKNRKQGISRAFKTIDKDKK